MEDEEIPVENGSRDHPIVEHTKLKMEFKVMVCPKCETPSKRDGQYHGVNGGRWPLFSAPTVAGGKRGYHKREVMRCQTPELTGSVQNAAPNITREVDR